MVPIGIHPLEEIVHFEVAIFGIADDRISDVGEMDAKLMRPSCKKLGLDEGIAGIEGLETMIDGVGFLAAVPQGRHFDDVGLGILLEREVDRPVPFYPSTDEKGVFLFEVFSFPEKTDQFIEREQILPEKDDAGGVSIQTMGRGREESCRIIDVEFSFFGKIVQDHILESDAFLAFLGMDKKTLGLVGDEDVLVLVEDIEIRLDRTQDGLLPELLEQILLQIDGDMVSLFEQVVDLGFDAVYFDVFLAEHTINERDRGILQSPLEELVDALRRFRFFDDEFHSFNYII